MAARRSDLGIRTASALVMLAVAGGALWLGGLVWTLFVALIALGVFWEWRRLVVGFESRIVFRALWDIAGMAYIAIACVALVVTRSSHHGLELILAIVATVIAIDVGAYFSGRAIGGPKIAPKISPSKTWAGLAGGAAGAILVLFLAEAQTGTVGTPGYIVVFGLAAVIIAQSGDFFESWMKRRAGVKDSSNLIPGHGGLFDRVDGLIAVLFVLALVFAPSVIDIL